MEALYRHARSSYSACFLLLVLLIVCLMRNTNQQTLLPFGSYPETSITPLDCYAIPAYLAYGFIDITQEVSVKVHADFCAFLGYTHVAMSGLYG